MAENTFDILRKLIAQVKCKPNWEFELVGDEPALFLNIIVYGYDNFNHERKFNVRHERPVPIATYNVKSWRRWILDQCLAVEAHEVCENLRFIDGDNEMRPFLPTHGPGEDPYAIREYRNEDDAFTTQDGSMRVGPGPSGIRK